MIKHHIFWLANAGADSFENTFVLCPNCHRKMYIVADVNDVVRLRVIAKTNAI